jgi:hypothetical protein
MALGSLAVTWASAAPIMVVAMAGISIATGLINTPKFTDPGFWSQVVTAIGTESISGGISAISTVIGTTPDPLVKTIRYVDPLILDLDGDGLEITALSKGIKFDADGDTIKTGTAWAGADYGMLVWDRNGNGTIDKGGRALWRRNGTVQRRAHASRAKICSTCSWLDQALEPPQNPGRFAPSTDTARARRPLVFTGRRVCSQPVAPKPPVATPRCNLRHCRRFSAAHPKPSSSAKPRTGASACATPPPKSHSDIAT